MALLPGSPKDGILYRVTSACSTRVSHLQVKTKEILAKNKKLVSLVAVKNTLNNRKNKKNTHESKAFTKLIIKCKMERKNLKINNYYLFAPSWRKSSSIPVQLSIQILHTKIIYIKKICDVIHKQCVRGVADQIN